jgi:hypothetical protein
VKEKTSRRRVSRRMAIASVALMSVAAPAAASVVIQNFIQGNVTGAPACFTKIAGNDSTVYGTVGALAGTGPYVKTDPTTTLVTGGITYINEKVDIRGFAGDRTKYTDVIRYKNNCTIPLKISLIPEADPAANPATSAGWADMNVRAFITKTGVAVPALPAGVTSVALETDTTNWDQQFSISAAGVVTAPSAVQTVAPGAELQGAFSVDVSTGITATRTFRYTAQATS